MTGWSGRVRIIEGEDGRAYRPGQLLVRGTLEQLMLAGDLLGSPFLPDGADPPCDGDQIPGPNVELASPWTHSAQHYFKLSNYNGDLAAAIILLKANGLQAQHNHVFFSNSYWADTTRGDPAYGNPAYGNPAYGNPAYGNPAYGNPAYGNPAYGNPAYGNPAYGNPAYGNPAYGNPAYGNPAYGNPAYGNPAYGNPACGSPIKVCGCGPPTVCRCDLDRCASERRGGLLSLVHPSPFLARYYLPERSARRYQLSGVRPNTAVPFDVPDTKTLPTNEPWDQAAHRIAVIDTGWPIGSPNLEPGELFNEAFESTLVDGDVPDVEGDDTLDPASGHGMFIAGVILRYVPSVGVKVVKALSTYGDGDEDDIARRIDELVNVDEMTPLPDIINLSLGTYAPEEPDVLAKAITNAIAKGVVIVASAGNDGISRKQYPAAYPGVVSVGALGQYGPAPFSNWGSWVRASAPGVDIASGFWTYAGKTVCGIEPDQYENWALWSGTSFAAPIVAAALVRTMRADGCDVAEAVRRTIDNPCLARLPCYGTIVNPPCDLDLS